MSRPSRCSTHNLPTQWYVHRRVSVGRVWVDRMQFRRDPIVYMHRVEIDRVALGIFQWCRRTSLAYLRKSRV